MNFFSILCSASLATDVRHASQLSKDVGKGMLKSLKEKNSQKQ
jgi:hypothetical protein